MKLDIKKSFGKDLKSFKNPKVKSKLEELINCIKSAVTLLDIPYTEPMKGHSNFYRIKLDHNFRIGIYLRGDQTVELLRFGSREDFYKSFP